MKEKRSVLNRNPIVILLSAFQIWIIVYNYFCRALPLLAGKTRQQPANAFSPKDHAPH